MEDAATTRLQLAEDLLDLRRRVSALGDCALAMIGDAAPPGPGTRRQQRRQRQQLLAHGERQRAGAAADLHDHAVQPLAAALMNFEAARELLQGHGPPEAHAALDDALHMLRAGLEAARRAMSRLWPAALEDFGVVAAIDALVAEIRQTTGIDLEWVCRAGVPRLPAAQETALFRIVQEALENLCRHSRARHARLELRPQGGRLRLTIADAGMGFDPATIPPDCCGLAAICQRAELLDGTVQIDSAPGRGTRIIVELPLPAPPTAKRDSAPPDLEPPRKPR